MINNKSHMAGPLLMLSAAISFTIVSILCQTYESGYVDIQFGIWGLSGVL